MFMRDLIKRMKKGSAGIILILFGGMVSCSQDSPLLKSAPTVSRNEMVEISKLYSEMEWEGSASNAFHGVDPDGNVVHTPDVCSDAIQANGYWWRGNGARNVGMPYKWGGWDTPVSFKKKLGSTPGNGVRKYAAGDIASDDKVKKGDAAVSKYAAGIDCSGFVSRCWRLDRSYSTKELAAFCDKIPMEDLKVGDILLKPGTHVALFLGWADGDRSKMLVSEAGPLPFWGVSEHTVPTEVFVTQQYDCYRYKNLKND